MKPGLLPTPQGPELRDIHLPHDPSWWPPAPGWWVLAFLLLASAVGMIWWWRRRRRVRRAHARVLGEIDALLAAYAVDGDGAALAAGMHQLLRRVARCYAPGAELARGEAWRQVLAQVPVDAGTLAPLLALEQAIYRPQPFDAAAAHIAMRRWLARALRMKQARRGREAHA
ncbi:hypothetical protein ASG87_02480 [Frateuria sp. Soil773]|uniref:DUF4381 domain-containing protein n=1 Tax=Frateuria sp. Soil773 TaxID=1736407 RepID=UPI0006F6BBC4|nr:DUF4381 domain-containing protein [Frateuria sp. Soil773]KRE89834.1 hypothetical protein ASG87_02480 [Frateuria sp. Soil773]